MALITIKFMSEVLGRNTEIIAIVPQKNTSGDIGQDTDAKSEKYKTLLLLHGRSDDNSIWLRRTSIERYATEKGIAVIMPSADVSFYTDMKYGDKFYTFISQEVLTVTREFLPLSEKREDNFIAGNSMGGYGALKIALKNPSKFAATIGLSSVADVGAYLLGSAPNIKNLIFGEGEIPADEDLFEIAKKTNGEKVKPRVLMCVGKDDFLYSDNFRLKDCFGKLDYDYTFIEDEGMHNWAFWDRHIQTALAWMLK